MPFSTELALEPINKKSFPKTVAVLENGLTSKVAPGIVAGVWRASDPDHAWVWSGGQTRIPQRGHQVSPEKITESTVFDLASLTKVVATTPLVAALVERGLLHWDTPVQNFFPAAPFDGITVRHLLTHTAGFTSWKPYFEELQKRWQPEALWKIPVSERQKFMKEILLSQKPDHPPEEQMVYSDLSFLILGFLLESLLSESLDQAVAKNVWKPMGIAGFEFIPVDHSPASAIRRYVAATEGVQGQVHDENCWAMGGIAGHAGVFGNFSDLVLYCRALFGRFFSYSNLQEQWTPHFAKQSKNPRGLGWDMPTPGQSSSGRFFSPYSVGHLGFSGTSLWIDPDAALAVILLTNRVHPSRDNMGIKAFRPEFHDALRSDLISARTL